MTNKVYVLGAADPEMEEIESVLKQQGLVYFYALKDGSRVKSETAYQADSISGYLPKNAQVVLIECFISLPGIIDCIDHHRPGDPGYGAIPSNFLEGSSLGQLLTALQMTPTKEQLLIAAADHCPTQAYMGLCPGVDIEDLKRWRTASRAKRRGMSPLEMEEAILFGKSVLENAEKIEFNGKTFPWLQSRDNEVCEASARFNIPFMYMENAHSAKFKSGIMGADPDTIQKWMQECGLTRVYGDPIRGYAGGYSN